MKVPSFLQSFFPIKKEISFESPGKRKTIVESVKGWRAYKKAEQGLYPEQQQIIIDLYRCDLCGCSIGPGYDQEKMYLFPVRKEACYSWKIDRLKYYEVAWLKICESCAHTRSRYLPTFLLILRPEYWTTTMLICKEGEQPSLTTMQDARVMTQIRKAIADTVASFMTYLFLVVLVSYGISLSQFSSKPKVALLPFSEEGLADLLASMSIDEMSPVLYLDFENTKKERASA